MDASSFNVRSYPLPLLAKDEDEKMENVSCIVLYCVLGHCLKNKELQDTILQSLCPFCIVLCIYVGELYILYSFFSFYKAVERAMQPSVKIFVFSIQI